MQGPDPAESPPEADTKLEPGHASEEEQNPSHGAEASSPPAVFSSEDDEDGLWEEALKAYTESGEDWTRVQEFLAKMGSDPKNATITVSAQRFHKYRSKHEEVWGMLSNAMGVTRTTIKVFGDPIKDVSFSMLHPETC